MRKETFTDKNRDNPFVKSAEFIIQEAFTDLGRAAGISENRIEGILEVSSRTKGDPLDREERPALVAAAKRAIDRDTL